jgi:hypothetical protein
MKQAIVKYKSAHSIGNHRITITPPSYRKGLSISDLLKQGLNRQIRIIQY